MINSSVKNNKGIILTPVLVFAFISMIIITGLTSWFALVLKSSRTALPSEQAFQIAEAGIEYYRWHLAHDNDDYQDGSSTPAVSPLLDQLVLWLDANDISGDGSSVSDGTAVTLWRDKSSNDNDFTTIDGQGIPTKITDGSKVGVYFEDDQLISTRTLTSRTPIEDVTIFAVVKTNDDTNGGYLLNTQNNDIQLSLPNDSSEISFEIGTSTSISANWNYSELNYYLWSFQSSINSGMFIRNNGVEVVSNGNSPNSLSNIGNLFLGGNNSLTPNSQNITVSEVLVYDKTLSESEIKLVEKYLDCRWEVTGRTDCPDDAPGTTYGPFVHDFLDKDGNKIGEFTLYITSPDIGSTVVTVESTGTILSNPGVSRTISAKLAIPSFVKYAFVADANIRFGAGTEVFGPIHSNGGIRFDGLAHNLITSARATYDDPDHAGNQEFGVHTHLSPADPLPPANVPDRFDVFETGREFPVPAVDFDGIASNLATIKSEAQSGGSYFGPSGDFGYRMVLKNNDTFDVYRVTSLANPSSSCTNISGDSDWSTWSIGNSVFLGNYGNPDNGVVFFEDHVWVEGNVKTARLTIAAGQFPDVVSNRKNIIITNDLTYTNYDGSDVVALIAQKNINIGMISEDDLRIDAAMIAQNGRIGRHYYRSGYFSWWTYRPGCEPYDDRDTITVYGTIGSRNRYGFAYTDGNGYDIRNINYDSNLLYSPPPRFPLTSDKYEVISWEEIE